MVNAPELAQYRGEYGSKVRSRMFSDRHISNLLTRSRCQTTSATVLSPSQPRLLQLQAYRPLLVDSPAMKATLTLGRHPTAVPRSPSTVSVIPLEKFPAEIRIMIYRLLLHRKKSDPCRRQPHPVLNLLQALRADPTLYKEALQIYYQVNTFVLWSKSLESFKDLSGKVISYIRTLDVYPG